MKRLIVCCDGTWNELSNFATNVVKFAQVVKPFDGDIAQVVYYQAGLGTRWYDRLPGGALGWGIDYSIQNAYDFLCFNYEPGDQIYLVGFSRGAYTVRSLAGMIYCSGLLKREHIREVDNAYKLYRRRDPETERYLTEAERNQQAERFRSRYGVCYNNEYQIPITLLGCWDTVGALGIPSPVPFLSPKLINRKYNFHNTTLNPKIQVALHAVAIDERRKVFDVTPMNPNSKNPDQILRQIWFPGGHGCVGGGTPDYYGLSDNTLLWMIRTIKDLNLGLKFDLTRLGHDLAVNPATEFKSSVGFYRLLGVHDRLIWGKVVNDDNRSLWQKLRSFLTSGRWETLQSDDRSPQEKLADLDESVKLRWHALKKYRPVNLKDVADLLDLGNR